MIARACGVLACAVLGACGNVQQLSPAGQLAYELSLATDDERMAAAWQGGGAIWMRRMNPRGGLVGEALRLTEGRQGALEPDLQWLNEDLLLAWYEKDAASGNLAAWLGRFSPQGQARWRRALSAPDTQGRNPVVRVRRNQAWVAWIETPHEGEPAVWTALVGSDGAYLQPPQRRVAVSADTWNLNAAVDDSGRFHVAYDSRVGSRARELHLLTASAAGATDRLLSSDDGKDSSYPDLALSGNHAALTWFDSRDGNSEVYLLVSDLLALRLPVDARATRVTQTRGESTGAYAAWNGDRLALVWCDDSEGQSEIYSQQFDLKATPRSAARRLTRNATQSSIPSIRRWRDGFALAWNEYQTTNDAGGPRVTASTAVISVF